ncbi:hypothetical protein [Leptospira stimsonii]|uniref:Lipoprotein n=1 Tax=Leptospira stimsonii TaxID=2202203 RepID=A0ABY2N3C0_9LEPT|nr:hypothetical protein [Leptospira stimsonii]TGK26132.1 hypothetical protein EHO98_01025 [Leptospira stimsonii]TGM14961.1 hypothetical protein EHQ90_10820 [Leptospira stimsonii]
MDKSNRWLLLGKVPTKENELFPAYNADPFSRKESILLSCYRFPIALILLFLLIIGCSTSKNSIFGTVFVRRGFTPEKKTKHIVFPIQIRSGWLLKDQNADQRKFVESRSFEKLELAILNYGGKVQERYNAEKQFRSTLENEPGFSEEKGIKIAKLLKGDVAVFTDFTDYGTASGNAILELTIKAMDVENGEIVWKAMYSGKALGLQDSFDLSNLESEIFEQLTNRLKQKTE